MSEQVSPTGAGQGVPKLKMVFRVDTWSIKARVNRSGREEGETIVLSGHLFAPSIDPETPLTKANALIKAKEAQDRMFIKIGKDNSFMALPLEEFAMERITARIREMAGDYGLAVSIEFEADETTDRQAIEYADFAFSKPPRATAKPAAASVATQPPQNEAMRAGTVPQSAAVQATR